MAGLLQDITAGFADLPPHGVGAVAVLLLYALESEVRFGARARSHRAGSTDRGSTLALSLASAVPVLGFALAMKGRLPGALPGMPAVAWVGVALGFAGLLIRLWAVLVLRDRYTRTLLVQEGHGIERGGPYRFVRHPGYLGSILCLDGIALASGNVIVLAASAAATSIAYAHRIRAEDAMLVAAFGEPYERYMRETRALVPSAGTRPAP